MYEVEQIRSVVNNRHERSSLLTQYLYNSLKGLQYVDSLFSQS